MFDEDDFDDARDDYGFNDDIDLDVNISDELDTDKTVKKSDDKIKP